MTKTVYACTHIEKEVEIDDFENGCQRNRTCVLDSQENITAETLPGLVEAIGDHCGIEIEQIFLPWFEFSPEIAEFFSVDRLENGEGYEPSKREKELWKQGAVILYNACYRFYIEKRELTGVRYEEFEQAGIDTSA